MAAAQQPNASDNSTAILWTVAGIFATLGIIWVMFKNQIISFYLHIKLYEASFLMLFSEQYFAPKHAAILAALSNPSTVTFNQLLDLGASVGNVLSYPFLALLLLLGVVVFFGNTTRVFKRTYSMKDLAKLEKNNWPQISPVVGLDLLKQNIDVGPWAMALTPMQFSKRYRLIEEVRPERREGMGRKDWDKIDILLKRGEANKIFAMQLGPLWNGVERLPPHTKALFAVFAARINADSKTALNMLAQLSASATTKLNMAGVPELLKKHLNTPQVQKIIQNHAYVYTVMASMLAGAREDGVQASADFLWLKPIDRKLWYTLNTVGRQTPFVEIAGVFAHWIAEKEAGRKLLVPVVEEASKALDLALKEVIYRPETAS